MGILGYLWEWWTFLREIAPWTTHWPPKLAQTSSFGVLVNSNKRHLWVIEGEVYCRLLGGNLRGRKRGKRTPSSCAAAGGSGTGYAGLGLFKGLNGRHGGEVWEEGGVGQFRWSKQVTALHALNLSHQSHRASRQSAHLGDSKDTQEVAPGCSQNCCFGVFPLSDQLLLPVLVRRIWT